jgi:hypothetical protein
MTYIDQAEFEGLLDQMVKTRLSKPTGWDALLYSLPGFYPVVVCESVVRNSLQNMIQFSDRTPVNTEESDFAVQLWLQGELPTPHPLDAAWWFKNSSLNLLARELRNVTSIGDEVLLLGAPTLFKLGDLQLAGRRVTLFDKRCPESSGPKTSSFRVDLLQNQPKLVRATAIAADPPWYLPEMRAFLWTACRNALRGATILISVPPLGARPGIASEWDELLNWARKIGLTLVDYHLGALPYISPPFEYNALIAAGIKSFPLDWRRGNLAVFSYENSQPVVSDLVPAGADFDWGESVKGRVQLRIRAATCPQWADPAFREVVPGAVLPSVSRRDKRIGATTLWTSGNRLFESKGAFVLQTICEALAKDQNPVSLVEAALRMRLDEQQRMQVTQAAGALIETVKIEEREIADWENALNGNLVCVPFSER